MLASEGLARRDDGEGTGTMRAEGPRAIDRVRAAVVPVTDRRKRVYVGIFLALLAVLLGYQMTPDGLVIAGDSVTYIGVTNNIVDGKGITSPFVNEWDELPPSRAADVVGHSPSVLWPPGYPVAVAAVTRLGLSVADAARWLSILAFAVVVVATGWLAARLAHGSAAAMAIAGLIAVCSHSLHQMTLLLYSDLLAAALSTLAVIALILALGPAGAAAERAARRPAWLAAFWVLAAATSLTRVAGAAVIVVGVVLVAWRYPAGLRRRLVLAGAVATAVGPLLLWRRHVAAELGATPASFSYHARWDAVTDTPRLLWEYLVAPELSGIWRVVAIAGLVALGLLVAVRLAARWWGRERREPLVEPRARLVVVATLVAYVVATLFAAYWFGALLTVDHRTYLSGLPLVVSLAVGLAAGLFSRPAAATRPRSTGIVPLVAIALVAVAVVVGGWDNLITTPVHASAHVMGTPDDQPLGQILPRYDLIVSDSPSLLYTMTGRSSVPPPVLVRPSTLERNPDHDAQLDAMGRLLRERNGVYVSYASTQFFGGDTFLPADQIVRRLDLVEVGRSATQGGVVWAPRRTGP
jgi:hypothetical protein